MNDVAHFSFTPAPGASKRQKPRALFLVLGIGAALVFLYTFISAFTSFVIRDEAFRVHMALLAVLFGIGALFALGHAFKNYYMEHEEYFELRVFGLNDSALRYTNIASFTFFQRHLNNYIYLKDAEGKKYPIDLRSYETPTLLSYLLTNAAKNLNGEQLRDEVNLLTHRLGYWLTPEDQDIIARINAEHQRT